MKITVTFEGPDDPSLDGKTITFEHASDVVVHTRNDIEDISCADAGCGGCTAAHRRITGTHHLELKATGTDGNRPLWADERESSLPDGLYWIGEGDGYHGASGLQVLRAAAEGGGT